MALIWLRGVCASSFLAISRVGMSCSITLQLAPPGVSLIAHNIVIAATCGTASMAECCVYQQKDHYKWFCQ